MGKGTSIVCAAVVPFKEEAGDQRLKEGIEKLRKALQQDAKATAERKTGLPKDWRSKVFK